MAEFTPEAAAAALERFDRKTDATVLGALRKGGVFMLRYAVTQAMITRGGKSAPVHPTKITVRSGKIRRALSVFGPTGGGGQPFQVGLELDLAAAPHGAAHELGANTRPHLILPVRAKALRWEAGGRVQFAMSVRHPGSRIRPRPFMAPSVKVGILPTLALVDEAVTNLAIRELKSATARRG